MKSSHLRKYAFALCLIILTALSFAESAQARGGPAAFGLAILVITLANIVFYSLVLFCCIRAIWVWRRKRQVAIWSILFATLPFLHYTVEVIRAQFEPGRRPQQIANMMQQRVVSAIRPRAIETNGFGGKEVGALVAVGVLDEVQGSYPTQNIARIFRLLEGPECVDFETSGGKQAEFRRVVLARHVFQRCVKETERAGPSDAPIHLYTEDRAPSRYTGPACLGGGNRPMELRWTPRYGGGLLAFWESPSYVAHAFPPFLFGYPQIWRCEVLHPDSPDSHIPDKFQFVATALGFKNVDDFSKSSDAAIVPIVLGQLITRMDAQYAHDHILALLGQWPSTPVIDETLNDQRVFKQSDYIIRKASALLTEPSEDERKKRLYPHLLTHVPTLLKICSHRTLAHDYLESMTLDSCSKLTSVAKRTGFAL